MSLHLQLRLTGLHAWHTSIGAIQLAHQTITVQCRMAPFAPTITPTRPKLHGGGTQLMLAGRQLTTKEPPELKGKELLVMATAGGGCGEGGR